MIDRPAFTVTLRPEPGTDGDRALRLALKCLLRRFGLRCVRLTSSDAQPVHPGREQWVADEQLHGSEDGQ